MSKLLSVVVAVAFVGLTFPGMGWAADPCPAELTEAKGALKSAQAGSSKATSTAKGPDVQAPRTMAGAKSQDVQAPRGQDVQSPRGQDVQAPRGQDVQSPRGQDVQSPRGQDVQSPRGQDVQAPRTAAGAKTPAAKPEQVKKASALIRDSEAACKKGDMALSSQKAKEALALLK
jgi:hypothetical protein